MFDNNFVLTPCIISHFQFISKNIGNFFYGQFFWTKVKSWWVIQPPNINSCITFLFVRLRHFSIHQSNITIVTSHRSPCISKDLAQLKPKLSSLVNCWFQPHNQNVVFFFSKKVNMVLMIWYLKEHKNCRIGSKVMKFLLIFLFEHFWNFKH